MAGLALAPLPVSAQPAPLVEEPTIAWLIGKWTFESLARQPDGQPLCRERWMFRADGTLRTESGSEILDKRFAIEIDADRNAEFVMTVTATNGLPDCMGQTTENPGEQYRQGFQLNNAGAMYLCEPKTLATGVVYMDCYGTARRVRE